MYSLGNDKIGPHVLNVSLPPVISCKNCSGCKSQCYALKAYRIYPTARNSWDDNLAMWEEDPKAYEEMIKSGLEKEKPDHFRWHVAGDIQSQNYLDMMISLAREYPRTRFLAFTKMYSLDYSARPANLEIIFSIWPTMELPEKTAGVSGFAWIDTDYRRKHKALKCSGSCEECMVCFYMSENELDVMFSIH